MLTNAEAIYDMLKEHPEGIMAKDVFDEMPDRFNNPHAAAYAMRSLEMKHLAYRERVPGTSYTRYKAMMYNPNKIINSMWRKDGKPLFRG